MRCHLQNYYYIFTLLCFVLFFNWNPFTFFFSQSNSKQLKQNFFLIFDTLRDYLLFISHQKALTKLFFYPYISIISEKETVRYSKLFFFNKFYPCNPSILQTTLASTLSHESSQTVPSVFPSVTTTRPSLQVDPPTKCTETISIQNIYKKL